LVAKNIVATGIDAIFTISRPETVVARCGAGFDAGRDVPDISQ